MNQLFTWFCVWEIKIHIMVKTTNRKTITLEVERLDTFNKVQAQVQYKETFSWDRKRLIFVRKKWEDDCANYKIYKNLYYLFSLIFKEVRGTIIFNLLHSLAKTSILCKHQLIVIVGSNINSTFNKPGHGLQIKPELDIQRHNSSLKHGLKTWEHLLWNLAFKPHNSSP